MNTWIFVRLLYHQWDSPQYIFKTLSEVSINSPPVRNRFFLLSVLIQIIISFVTAGMKTCLCDGVGVATQINTHTDCLIKNLFSYFSPSLFIVHDYSHRWGGLVRVGGQRSEGFRSSWRLCGWTGCWGSGPATRYGCSSLHAQQCTCGHGSLAPHTSPSWRWSKEGREAGLKWGTCFY